MNAIEAHGLGKSYGSVTALADVSLTVAPGEIVAVLGPNGAGKSTLVGRALGLLQGPGTCTFFGSALVDHAQASAVVGAVIDGNPLVATWSAAQHVDTFGRVLGAPRGRGRGLLEMVGLAEVADRPVKGMSLGMRQRLGLALALLDNPRCLVLDEPTTGLDPLGVGWLFSMLRAFADGGGAVLVSSHQLGELSDIADGVLFVRDGRAVWSGSTQEFLATTRTSAVRVRTTEPDRVAAAIVAAGGQLHTRRADALWTDGIEPAELARIVVNAGCDLLELGCETGDIQSAFAQAMTNEVAQ